MFKSYLLTNCYIGKEKSVAEHLRKLPEVKRVCGTFGAYDLVVFIETENQDRARDLIAEQRRLLRDYMTSSLTLFENGKS